jgi:hypothetical protein
MTKAILQSYLTTLFGLLAGGPVLVTASCATFSITLSPSWLHGLAILGAVGLIGLGVVAKAFNVHSTEAQTAAATATVENNPRAPAMVKAADKQAEGK